jgi:uridine kinase
MYNIHMSEAPEPNDQAPQATASDGEAFVNSVLSNQFELQESQLTAVQATQYLSQAILGLPGEGTKIISIIGGPASGKDTLVGSLIDDLKGTGLAADSIGTDDYGIGTREWRWEREREDPLKLKDFALLNQKVEAIKKITSDDEKVAVPTYDQKTGLAVAAGEENYTHKIGKTDVLFVQGDFDAVEHPDLMVFIDVPAETRMQVRIARDLAQRGEVDAEKVANSFKSRHEKQFIPYTAPAVEKAGLVLKVNPIPEAWQYDVYRAKPAP